MSVSGTLWAATVLGFIVLFAVDFWVVERKPHAFSPAEAARWVVLYILLALGFAVFLLAEFGTEQAGEFLAGYITEYSLSIDNLFVFVVLMASFAVPADLQHRVLLVGVAMALVLRTALIFVGAVAIQRFTATFFIFGAFLIWTAWKVARSHEVEADPEGNAIVRLVARRVPVTQNYDGHKWTTMIDGRRHVTPMALVILAIGSTDLLFAIDSIPAVFGLTNSAYIVFAVNGFALMGLRQMYFLLHGLLDRLVYLNRGLAVILAFIGVKLILEAVEATTSLPVPHIGTWVSLAVIVTILAVTVVTSLVAARRDPSLLGEAPMAELAEEVRDESGVGLSHLRDEDSQPPTSDEPE